MSFFLIYLKWTSCRPSHCCGCHLVKPIISCRVVKATRADRQTDKHTESYILVLIDDYTMFITYLVLLLVKQVKS